MFKNVMAIFALMLFANSSTAEVLFCRFDEGWDPTTYVRYDSVKGSVVTSYGQQKKTPKCIAKGLSKLPESCQLYKNVIELPAGPGTPFAKNGGVTLAAGNGDSAVIFVKEKATEHRFKVYPYRAYWGVQQIHVPYTGTWFDELTMGKFGPRGVCWTKNNPPIDNQNDGGGCGGGLRKAGNPDCEVNQRSKENRVKESRQNRTNSDEKSAVR